MVLCIRKNSNYKIISKGLINNTLPSPTTAFKASPILNPLQMGAIPPMVLKALDTSHCPLVLEALLILSLFNFHIHKTSNLFTILNHSTSYNHHWINIASSLCNHSTASNVPSFHMLFTLFSFPKPFKMFKLFTLLTDSIIQTALKIFKSPSHHKLSKIRIFFSLSN
jgi:hypothetical protein